MAQHDSDKDELDHSPLPPKSPRLASAGSSGLPINEPADRSVDQQRTDLMQMIEQLEGQLRYMGGTHPLRAQTAKRLDQLRAMLAQMR